MKKRMLVFAAALAACLLAGCSMKTSQSLSFAVETGDTIRIELDTTDGYSLKAADSAFEVFCGEERIAKGIFLEEEKLASYVGLQESDVEEVYERNSESIFYHTGNEWNWVFRVESSSTGVALVNTVSKDSAETCRALLEITKEP